MNPTAAAAGFWETSKNFLAYNIGNNISLTIGDSIFILIFIIVIGFGLYIGLKARRNI